MKWKEFIELAKASAFEWSEDNASRLSAALAYYTIFSIAPLLVISMAVVGFVLGREEADGQIMQQMEGVLGPQMSSLLSGIAQSAQKPGSGLIAGIIGFIVLIVGASGVFYELQSSLNTIWDVRRKAAKGIMGVIKTRTSSFLIIFVIGFLLLVSLALSTGVSAFGRFAGDTIPGIEYLLHVANFVVSFIVIGLLFAIIYKMLPDAEIRWGDVWVGAGVTSLLFAIGKLLISFYLGKSAIASPYGAAGSLVVLLAFIYYSAQIFFLGAEFTQLYANKFGSHIVPAQEAEPLPTEEPSSEKYPSSPGGKETESRESHSKPVRVTPARSREADGDREPLPKAEATPPVPVATWRAAMAGFIGGIFAGMYLNRPSKPV